MTTPAAPEPGLQQALVRLADEAGLDDRSRSLLWAAFDGDDALALAIAGTVSAPGGVGHADQGGAGAAPGSGPVWLSSIAVEGFRGIGARTELLLDPVPGLTLVLGRNGSGKSSFAEGLEALLTGKNLRWQDRPKAWQQGWRNLHHDGPTSTSAELHIEGSSGVVELVRRWGDSFESSTVDATRGGEPFDHDSLGWDQALASYKPLLSYNELGSMLEGKPSAIYDSVAAVLGLDRMSTTRERLRQARLAAEQPGKDLDRARTALIGELAGSVDERAVEAREVLAARRPDLDRLEALAFSDGPDGSDHLGVLATLPDVDHARCAALAADLAGASTREREAAGGDDARSDRLARLLRQIIDHHDHEGDGPCPACGQGRLDAAWRAGAEAEAEQLEREAAAVRDRRRRLDAARQAAGAALQPVPSALVEAASAAGTGGEPPSVLDELLADLAGTWSTWASTPPGPWSDGELVARLGDAAGLDAAIGAVRAEAAKQLAAHDAEWRPLARRLSTWIDLAGAAAEASQLVRELKAVEAFAKGAEAAVRTERFEPIARAAAELWAQLRQQSNVNLKRVALEGQATTRRVDLDVTVDDTDTSALGVMSQGELHALALALFLPRVTTTQSPFRFLVVDDPVQAMDPARVDGLAKVLASVAEHRQVIVLTHDDRLPASCRRLDIDAAVIEVSRRSGSRVTTSVSASPAERSLGDAYALARTGRLTPRLKRRIVPIHCRRALEAHVRDLAWRRLLPGRTHDEVEILFQEADTTVELLALLLFGEPTAYDAVMARLDHLARGSAGQVRYLNRAVHDPPADLDPEALTGSVRNLMRVLSTAAAS